MLRGSRIDTAGAVPHITFRGIECRKIFDGDADRDHFLMGGFKNPGRKHTKYSSDLAANRL